MAVSEVYVAHRGRSSCIHCETAGVRRVMKCEYRFYTALEILHCEGRSKMVYALVHAFLLGLSKRTWFMRTSRALFNRNSLTLVLKTCGSRLVSRRCRLAGDTLRANILNECGQIRTPVILTISSTVMVKAGGGGGASVHRHGTQPAASLPAACRGPCQDLPSRTWAENSHKNGAQGEASSSP